MNTEQILTLEKRFAAPLYHQRELAIVCGKGAKVWDAQGKAYYDCIGGQGVAVLGHSNPAIVEAICRQAEKLMICPPFAGNEVRATFLEKLAGIMPPQLQSFFLCNSGTEAVEAALKFARLATGRPGIVAAKRGFHGRTFGALSATAKEEYRTPFQPLVPDFIHVPYNNLEALEQSVNEKTAAVILEVIQGEGGVYPAKEGYLVEVEKLCRTRGAMLIIDEVQTGFGRTGKMFAFEHHGIVPDLVCMAKGIAGGIPMGAVAIGERVKNIKPGVHGSTFGGNPLACAAANAVIDYLQTHNLIEHAARLGERLQQKLRAEKIPAVREIRGMGLMIGIELRFRIGPYLSALQEAGVLAMGAGPQVIRLLPPLIITQEELDEVCEKLVMVLGKEG